jgi:hypothetical protein
MATSTGVIDQQAALDQIEQKFIRLRDEWKAQRGHHSDTVSLVMHPAYQNIIGMGLDAVPLLLRELATSPDRWFWALRAITEEDPVPVQDRGNSEAMTRAWLEWGKERGYQWVENGVREKLESVHISDVADLKYELTPLPLGRRGLATAAANA